MDTKKFQEIVGPTIRKIEKKRQYQACGSFRPLAELLVEWYHRKLAEEEVKKRD